MNQSKCMMMLDSIELYNIMSNTSFLIKVIFLSWLDKGVIMLEYINYNWETCIDFYNGFHFNVS